MHSDFPHTPFEKEKGTNPLFDSTESSESAQPLPPADVCAQHYSIRRTTTTVQRCLRRMDCAVRPPRGGKTSRRKTEDVYLSFVPLLFSALVALI